MLLKDYFAKEPPDGILVSCDFIDGIRLARPNQGVGKITVTAREWQPGKYMIRVIASMQPDTYLFSQSQPDNMKKHATRIVFNKNPGFECKEGIAEVGVRHVHSSGAVGLAPCHKDKIHFIQLAEMRSDLFDISGKIYYQVFKDNLVLEPCSEQFRIRLLN